MDRRSYHVTIKGLVFDGAGRVLLVREATGGWDLPGGRIEHGETFHEALRRECREEMALECEILDESPHWAWTARDRDGLWKVVLCFRVRFETLAFTASDECVAIDFFDAQSFSDIPVVPQTRPLLRYLRSPA
jgi:8-oxo-dGTP pyrophosphatase MutT (NUDIX family)